MGLPRAPLNYCFFTGLHAVCFVLALTVCGLYGTDLNHASHVDKYADSKWVYAVVVGSLSAVTCVVYFIPAVLRVAGVFAAAWNLILFILWITLFGAFGALYIKEHAEGDSGIQRMKNAVWVDLTNALLWLIAALGAFGYWWKHWETRSQFTGCTRV